jgi:hypothetical protein
MENEKIFKTKTGFCHILDDKIILTRDGIIGNVAKVTVGNGIVRILSIYGLIAIGLFYFAYNSYQKGNKFEPFFFTIIGSYLIYGILTSYNNSAEPIIERGKIKSVKFKQAIKGLTRSRFEIKFEDNSGKIKKRLVMLPGSLSNGDSESKIALKIMAEEGLIED